ncbi:MAG: hypothetical protein MUC60_02875 [Oscillatoria sp. Prado101]|jgi:hypothetical protein|nr:hypothetical protein [Oscillatoria sp. Prado101]
MATARPDLTPAIQFLGLAHSGQMSNSGFQLDEDVPETRFLKETGFLSTSLR